MLIECPISEERFVHRELVLKEGKLKQGGATQWTSDPWWQNTRIVLAHEEPARGRILSAQLEAHGARVILTHDVVATWSAVLNHCPQICVLDVRMEGLLESELVQRIREHSELGAISIVLLGRGRPFNYLVPAADDYVPEPVYGGELTLRVGKQIKEQRERYEAALALEECEKRCRSAVREAQEISDTLRLADARKDHFLALLSHELRSPLAPICNSLWLLEQRLSADSPEQRALHVIKRQTQHMTRLIDDLLDMTRITRGKLSLRLKRIELNELVHATLQDHRDMLERSGLNVSLQEEDHSLVVLGDPARMAQIVVNLLENSAKFTAPGGRVTVALGLADDNRGVIRISDTGAGMEQDELANLFQPFFQGNEMADRDRSGLGLGLFLVRSLVELHGGTIQARSAGRGCGTEFLVELPLHERPQKRGSMLLSRERAIPPRRVLIVEDDVDAAETLRDVLATYGHRVQIAQDGPSGIEMAREFLPEVVLCDVGLPGMSGYEVAMRLREDPRARSVTLVALTGHAFPGDLERARQAGFAWHLAKPANPDAIQRILAEGASDWLSSPQRVADGTDHLSGLPRNQR